MWIDSKTQEVHLSPEELEFFLSTTGRSGPPANAKDYHDAWDGVLQDAMERADAMVPEVLDEEQLAGYKKQRTAWIEYERRRCAPYPVTPEVADGTRDVLADVIKRKTQ